MQLTGDHRHREVARIVRSVPAARRAELSIALPAYGAAVGEPAAAEAVRASTCAW